MNNAAKEFFIAHLLRTPYEKILSAIRAKATTSPKCVVSYAWPMLKQEEGLQERVLQMMDDLQIVGIDAFMDITKGDGSTSFRDSLPQWIESSDFVILVGSTSFPTRAADPLTLTHLESVAIGRKKNINSNSIIPVLFEGRFGTSFPPGYQDTIGGRFTKPTEYLKELPGVAASILGVSNDPEIAAFLTSYAKESESIIVGKSTSEMMTARQLEEAKNNLAMQQQYWKSRLLVLHSKFSLEQLREIDGMVNVRTKLMDEYCSRIMKKIKPLQRETEQTSKIGEAERRASYLCQIPIIGVQLESFIASPTKKVLLLCGPPPSSSHLLNCIALHSWDSSHTTVPIFVDLTAVQSPAETCVEESLIQHGLDILTIQQAKKERASFLFLVSGFESCGIPANLYMRNKMYSWPGTKVIFTISQQCKETSPCIEYYFIPCKEQALQVHDADAFEMCDLIEEIGPEPSSIKLPANAHISSQPSAITSDLSTPQAPSSASPKINQASSVVIDSKPVSNFENITNTEQQNKGFLLLQHDIIRFQCHHFLDQIRSLAFKNNNDVYPSDAIIAFISYAWPQDSSARNLLQQQLLELVDDLSKVHIKALLDIMQLHPGSDVKKFMEQEINNCHTVLWIGTPDLKARIKFKDDGTPATNAAVEFCHIKAKASIVSPSPCTIQSLLFRGTSSVESFPDFGGLNTIHHDFTIEKSYYLQLPKLVASIFGIAHESPSFQVAYSDYCKKVRLLEASFTKSAIQMRLERNEKEAEKLHQEASSKLQSLLDNIPSAYIKEQQDAESIKIQALISSLVEIKQSSLSPSLPHSQALEYYVPLKGGATPDSESATQFEAYDKIMSFFSPGNNNRTSILFGTAGAGKSLFARSIERALWQAWNSKVLMTSDSEAAIPIFISLPQHFSLQATKQSGVRLIDTAFANLHFTPSDIVILKTKFRFVFILDGLDETPLDLLPASHFLQQTQITEWLTPTSNNKVVVLCRTQQVPIIETKIRMSIHQYFSLTKASATITSSSLVESFYLMPFNTTQIQLFLQGYSQSPEAKMAADWTAEDYEQNINNVGGLLSLVHTPFLLRLVVGILPRLVKRQKVVASIMSANVYQEFTRQLFERETWKRLSQSQVSLNRNLLKEFQQLSERIAQSLFARGSTLLPLQDINLWEEEQQLLVGIPIHINNGQIKFIHKSVQEYFISQAWVNCMSGREEGAGAQTKLLISANLVSHEAGILGFLSQLIQHQQHAPMLIQQVLASRTDKSKQQQIASSNAMSILNAAHFSFSGMDLSGTSIPSANLQHAVMEQTNFAHSNLSECILFQAWMKRANLQSCEMANVELGELPWMDSGSTCYTVFCDEESGLLVTGHEDARIRVWDIATMNQIGDPLQGHTRGVFCVAFHGGKIVSGSSDSTIRVWDLTTMKPIGDPLQGHTGWVNCVAICDGKVVSGGSDSTIRVWDIETMKQIGDPLQGHTDVVGTVAVHGGKIVSGSDDMTIRVWDLETMKQIGDALQGHTHYVRGVAIHAGKIVSGSADKTVRVWDMETMKQVGYSGQGHTDVVNCVAVHDGRIVSGSADRTIRVWDMETMRQIGDPLQGHTDFVNCVAVHGGKIVSGSNDKAIRVWNMGTINHLGNSLEGHTDFVNCVVVHDGMVVSGSNDKTILVWDMETMKQIGRPLKGHTDVVRSVAVCDGKIVSASDDGTIRVWDMAKRRQIGDPLRGHTDSVRSVAIHAGRIVSGSADKTIRVWDMETLQQIGDPLKGHSNVVNCIAVADGKIVSGSDDMTVRVWDMATMTQIGIPLQGHTDSVRNVAVHEGKIVSVSNDKAIRVWNMAKMKRIGKALRGHTKYVNCVAVANGKIVSGGADKTIRVWDMATLKQIGGPLEGHTGYVRCVAVCDGKIVSGSADKTILVWDMAIGDSLQAMPAYLVRCSSRLPLCFEQCNVEEVQGLTELQARAMKQRGAFGTPYCTKI